MQTLPKEIRAPYEDEPAEIAAGIAISERRTSLEYHPVYKTGADFRLAFYEAQLVLLDQNGRRIPNSCYLGPAQETELGRDIDSVTLELGIESLAAHPRHRLIVPMSARSLADVRWWEVLEKGLALSPYLGERLILEIDEPSAMQLHEGVARFMADMQGRGVAFALGRFGAGATAFNRLRRLSFDLVKIAPEFVRRIDEDADSQVAVSALVCVAQHFEMSTIAPAVTSQEEAACLAGLGVDCLAGRFIGAPVLHL